MPPIPQVLDLEKLRAGKQTGPLSEETQAQIAAQAELEIAEEEKARKAAEDGGTLTPAPEHRESPADDPSLKTTEELEAEQKKADEEKSRKEAEDKAEKERLEKEAKEADDALIASIMAKPDEELSAEEKQRKAELTEKNPDLAFQEEVKAYAKAENLTVDEAKSVLEAERKIVEQHQGDPKKLARTVRSAQSGYSKLEAKIKHDQERASAVLKENEIIIGGKKMTFDEAKEQMIPAFRNRYTGKSFKVGDKETPIAELDDEKVFELAKTQYQQQVKAHTEKIQEQIAADAKKKRDEITSKLPSHALPFKDQFVEILGFVKDSTILDDDFDPDFVLNSARGAFYTPEKIKELEIAAFNKGRENAKILGLKNSPQGTGSTGSVKPKADSPDADVASLTEEHKKRALDMFQGATFDNAGWDEARKYREYVDHLKSVGEWPVKPKT